MGAYDEMIWKMTKETLKIGMYCKRKPSGRLCKIIEIKQDKIKIHDPGGRWCGWVSNVTFDTKWTSIFND